MTEAPRRGVTRGYVVGLIAAAATLAVAFVVAVWGMLGLLLERDPIVTPDVPAWVAPVLVFVALGLLVWGLWIQAIALLRGRRSPLWGNIIALSFGAYLVWAIGGSLGGMSLSETWVSPFALSLVMIGVVTSLLFWAVLARRVYTDRPAPTWPWERAEGDE